MNQCSGCDKNFRTRAAFDMHRVGKFEPKTEAERRRCMTTKEMEAAGMQVDGNGTWRGPANPYFQKLAASAVLGSQKEVDEPEEEEFDEEGESA